MLTRILLRAARPGDAAEVCEYNVRLARETEGKELDAAVVRRGVEALLADAAKGRYFVAEQDGRVVGQLAITFEWSDWRNGWFWWIQSVYIAAEWRRQGVFRALFDHVRAEAGKAGDVIGIRLYVEEENHSAHQTYHSLGMSRTTYGVMELCPI